MRLAIIALALWCVATLTHWRFQEWISLSPSPQKVYESLMVIRNWFPSLYSTYLFPLVTHSRSSCRPVSRRAREIRVRTGRSRLIMHGRSALQTTRFTSRYSFETPPNWCTSGYGCSKQYIIVSHFGFFHLGLPGVLHHTVKHGLLF
jgi:hypothetical protein